MNTNNGDALQWAFEAWANAYWAQGLDATYSERFNNYDDAVVEGFWQAFQHAHKLAWNAQQAEIDRLMLEYCPDEMTAEQLAEWGKHQRRVRE
jgi:hypothetical protein